MISVTVRGIEIPADELSWRFSRSSGPGGQAVNTGSTRVELAFDLENSKALPSALKQRALHALAGRLHVGVITVVAAEYRSQLRNRQAAATRLSRLLEAATAPPVAPRRPTRPTTTSVRRRLEAKRRRSELKQLRRPVDGSA